MTANSRIRDIAPFILNLGTRWRLVFNLMLYPENEHRYSVRRFSRPQSRSRRFGEDKSLPSYWELNPGPIHLATTLPWLLLSHKSLPVHKCSVTLMCDVNKMLAAS